ncbi:hypothetical protein L1887_53995 [Cichorium endivia]|nr:hypothetical protein L1887_53995 [Cichorium endivia]
MRYPSGTEQSKERTLQPGFLTLEHPSLEAICGAKLVRAARLQIDRHSSAAGHDLLAGAALPDADSLALDRVLAAEGASVLGHDAFFARGEGGITRSQPRCNSDGENKSLAKGPGTVKDGGEWWGRLFLALPTRWRWMPSGGWDWRVSEQASWSMYRQSSTRRLRDAMRIDRRSRMLSQSSRLCATAACRAEDACSEYRRSTWQQRVRLLLLDWRGADVEVLSLLHVGEGCRCDDDDEAQHTLALGRSHTVRSLPALSTFTGLAALSDWQPSLRTRAATRGAAGPRAHLGDQPAALGLWLAVSDSPLAASRSFELRAPDTGSAARDFPASLRFRFVSMVWLAIRKFRDACWPLSWKS